jgi:RecB family exonuclease
MEGGAAVLETLQQARDEIARLGATGRAALEGIIRHFHLDVATPPVAALLEFVSAWEGKAITHTKQIGELLEYLEYFREAGGAVPITARDENAVRLMTAHAAKGLEFKHVFILRANSNSFPGAYKEPLFEFPRELRNRDSVALDEDKSLHDQEERRLFYVAMTRACDSLTMYARQGTGKDKTPAGLLRDLVKDANLGRWLRQRQASGFQTDLFGEVPSGQFASRTSQWIALPPAADLSARLSATAVQTYETCPLQFKLEREWKIPSEVPGAMQYGAAMHRVLRSYYESVRLQRPLPEETLLDLFRADLAQAGFQDRYQYELYEKQGIEQLKGHLIACQRLPEPKVLHTEEFFEVRVGDTVVVGRIDRVDQLADGRVVIIDYKTGRPQSQEDADESLQLSIYALAAREKWGYDVGQVVFYNLEENAPVVTQRSAMQLDDARRKVEEVARAIAAGKFDPQAGFYCKFCAFRNLCPETEKRIFSIAPAGKKSQATGLPPA